MKHFKFLGSLAALAMLGACASDAPEAPNTQNVGEDEGDYRYITISIEGSETRATTDDLSGLPIESEIKDMFLLVTNDNGDTVIEAYNDGALSSDKKTATFKVSFTEYNDLTNHAGNNSALNVYVYVNGKAYQNASLSKDDILTGAVTKKTWSSTNGFLMSNSAACKVIKSDGVGKGNSREAAWSFTNTINVSRLAVRFDYVKTGDNSYELLSDKAVKMSVVAIAPVTLATQTYRLPQFSADGSTTGMAPFEANDRPYAVTAVSDATIMAMGYYFDTTGDDPYNGAVLQAGVDGKEIGYAHPNSLAGTAKPSFKNAPFAVVKAEITGCTGRIEKAKAAGDAIYALNGVLLGGVKDLKEMAKTSKKIAIAEGSKEYASTSDEADHIKNALTLINAFLVPENATKSDEDFLDLIKTAIPTIVELKATKDSSNQYHYYTYYAQQLVHDNTNGLDTRKKYNILRNHIYNLGVQSFEFIGHSEDCATNHEISNGEAKDKYITLTISVDDWKLNTTNASLKL